jgi:hypothetical protein
MENGITKHKGATILNTPSGKYPHMVQVIKTSKKLNEHLGRKFITLHKCITTIESMDTERLIEKSKIGAIKELQSWIIMED